MSFSDSYANVLSPFVEKYKDAKNERERKVVIQNAADAVSESQNLREGAVVDLPKDLQKVYLNLCSCSLSADYYKIRSSLVTLKHI